MRGMPQHVYTPRQASADKMLQMMFLHRLCHFLRAEFLVCCACRGSTNPRFGNKINSRSAPARVKPFLAAKGHHSAIAWSENTRVSPCLNTSAWSEWKAPVKPKMFVVARR